MMIKGYVERAQDEDRIHSVGPNKIPAKAPATIFNGTPEKSFSVAHKYIISKEFYNWTQPFFKRYRVFNSMAHFEAYRNSCGTSSNEILVAETVINPFSFKYMVMKRNHPVTGKKYDYCNVYSRFLWGYYVRRFVYEFTPDPTDRSLDFTVVMFLHNYSYFADTIYKGTRIRWNGTTPIGVAKGSTHFNMILLNDDEPSLIDNIQDMYPGFGTLSLPALIVPGFINKLIAGQVGRHLSRFNRSQWPWRCENPFGIFHKYYYTGTGLLDVGQIRKDFMFDVRELPQIVPPSRIRIDTSGNDEEITENVYEVGKDIYNTSADLEKKTCDGTIDGTVEEIFSPKEPKKTEQKPVVVNEERNNISTYQEDSLVFICMGLVLKQQEKERQPPPRPPVAQVPNNYILHKPQV